MTYTSKAYGLTISSSFRFPELTPAGVGADVDVTIERGRVERQEPLLAEPGLSFWAWPGAPHTQPRGTQLPRSSRS